MQLLAHTSPINWQSPLNRGLLRWWLCLPQRHGGNVWRDLTRKSDATISGAAAESARTRQGGWGCYVFDGSNDYGQTPTIDLSAVSKMTVAFWSYWNAYANDNDTLIESSPSAFSNIGGIRITPNSSTGNVLIRVNTSGSARSTITVARPTAAVWNHWCVLFDRLAGSQQCSCYINGVLQPPLTTPDTNTTSTGGFGNWQWCFHATDTSTQWGAGRLDDVRIYNRLLTASETISLGRASRFGYPNELRWVRGLPFSQLIDEPVISVPDTYFWKKRTRHMACIKGASETVSSLNTSKPFTTIPGNAKSALVTVNTQSVRYRQDGQAPTASNGQLAVAGSQFPIYGRDNLENFRVIEVSASATLWVDYFDSDGLA